MGEIPEFKHDPVFKRRERIFRISVYVLGVFLLLDFVLSAVARRMHYLPRQQLQNINLGVGFLILLVWMPWAIWIAHQEDKLRK